MKSVIGDYFGQGSNGSKCTVISSQVTSEKPDETHISEERLKTSILDEIVNGREKKMSKEKACKTPPTKFKTMNCSSSAQGKRRQKKNVPEASKQVLKEDKLGKSNAINISDVKSELASPKNFALKIRIKSKDQSDNGGFIEDFGSPECAVQLSDLQSKELKSPQGTMLKYLVQKHNCIPEKDTVISSKAKVNISDFFSPTKEKDSATNQVKTNEISDKNEVTVGAGEKTSVTPPLTSKLSLKKTKKISLSIPKNRKNSKEKSPLQDKSPDNKLDAPDQNIQSTSTRKSKPRKKSLSLPKTEGTDASSKSEEPVKAQIEGNTSNDQNLSQPLKNAFEKIMSKTNQANPVDTLQQSMCKKRKRVVDDDLDNNLGCKPLKSFREDSPVRTVRKGSTNQISCDSDDDSSSMPNHKQPKNSSSKLVSEKSEEQDTTSESKVEESKRNSLMSYFAKVSKEEVLAKEEKIEMKVKALIHSPPTTPSKKIKRRSINSLPGGAASLSKKKSNLRSKLKESINAIEIIDSEELKVCDSGKKDSQQQGKKHSSQSAKQKQETSSPLKIVADISNENLGISPRSLKTKALSKGKMIKETISTKTCLNDATQSIDEESLATPLENVSDESKIGSSITATNGKTPWKLKVCLSRLPLPTTQGTLLEEESDNDEIFLSRQDKKRKVEKQSENKKSNPGDTKEQSQSPDIIFVKKTVSDVKIAPLFTKKVDNQARQLFLQSGVPEQVKRTLETQRSLEEQEVEIFPKQSHIQQKSDEWTWSLPLVSIPLTSNTGEIPSPSCKFSIRDFNGGYDILDEIDHIMSASCKGPEMRTMFGLPIDVIRPILRSIKQDSKNIMVVNTFKSLRKKHKEDDFFKAAALSALADTQKPKRKSSNRKSSNVKPASPIPVFRAQLWTEKYKPSTASEIIGNTGSVQQLKRWLEAWRKASEDCSNLSKLSSREDMKRKRRKKDLLDDDDFLVSDNSSDGANSNLPLGVAVLYGPNGNGKTSTVYALAKDLGYKVLEVNASEKRNGKLVLSKLSEATQSHQVQQNKTAEQGFAALFAQKPNANKCKKSNELIKSNIDVEEEKGKKMSLILFEDVDIVFEEEDEGFLSAITNLVSTSKRPVILTTTDPESPIISRFMNSSSLILHFSCPPNLISSWLQIVCVVEGIYAASDTIKDLVSLCKGDFRRALLQTQLWIMSGASNLLMPSLPSLHSKTKTKKNSKNNDAEDISDSDEDGTIICPPPIPANTDCIVSMIGRNFSAKYNEENSDKLLEVPYPLDLGLFWWNLPPILSLNQIKHAQLPEKSTEDLPASGQRQMLDNSFLDSFCTEDGNVTDSCYTNEDSDVTCSQATSVEEPVEVQHAEPAHCSVNLSCVEPNAYKSCCSQEEMISFLTQMYIVSSIDIIAVSCQLPNASCLEPMSRFSHPVMKDSLSLVKLEVKSPNYVMQSTAEDMCHWLAEQSLANTRNCFGLEKVTPVTYNNCLPDQEEHKWRDAHSGAEQGALLALPLCMRLERRAIAIDYLPALRTFCRLERNRSIINTKRRNRFYHYLKSLGAVLSEPQLEILCHTMCDL